MLRWIRIVYAGCLGFLTLMCSGQVRVLVDQVGYETTAPKHALVMGTSGDHPEGFALVDYATGKTVVSGVLKLSGKVYDWGGRVFWTADFSSWATPGRYELHTRANGTDEHSCMFEIADNVLERNTLSNVIYYFKGQRSSGLFDQADRHLAVPGEPGRFVDVHGGWYDATGDYGIHLSQLNLTPFNTQQVPLVAWTALASYNTLKTRGDENFVQYERRLLDEGLFGADFLVRMKRPGQSFFESISAPGRLKLAKDRTIGNPNFRFKIKTSATDTNLNGPAVIENGPLTYQVSFRSGGGMAIAALALASTMPASGDFTRAEYLRTAEDAFRFLDTHNVKLLPDGKESIIDDYCALMAATELYRATHKPAYLAAADKRAANLMARLAAEDKYHDYWRQGAGSRPYFNPSDAGLPVISLIEYRTVASAEAQARVLDAVKRSLGFELAVTDEVNNPFGYARQLVRVGDGQVRTAFFFPHDAEAAPWWQGEDARIASLAAAARMAAPLFTSDAQFHAQLEDYAWHQLHWILGRNPFDASLLNGSGHGFAPYMFFNFYEYTSAPGAVVNGITASFASEDGIAFNEGYATTGKDDDWRWTEQWLPHAAWYMYAVSLPH
ncbi:glycoside hydrolase family 9 protein [Edaphobacter sp.]|uniref:glycoside hydrolase family 9 protein n=1 Tax=Edaphobacter sp. TaxID=1934404 RepID=UPI002DB6D338|nr:glycoside hydrolase family 9 protein [Edaphobacter sp.]HEU5340017.1 glycoside hydrolase family 9 protein [Edaphobacter sp.]